MTNLLKKMQIMQFIIIIALMTFNHGNDHCDTLTLNKDSEYYNFLQNIVKYNNITKKINNQPTQPIHDIFLKNNDYFYIFANDNNVHSYFFKEKNSDKHSIYFSGINNPKDIKTILDIISNKFTYDNVENILNKNGTLYMIHEDKIKKVDSDHNIFDVFDFLYKDVYKTYNIQINGYSLGGPLSQVFTLSILNKYDNLDIENYNIESWFIGDKEDYNEVKNIIKLCNIYNPKSVLFHYNNLFQKYNKVDYLIKKDNDNIDKYILKCFPNGIIKYINNTHLLSNIL